MRPSRVIVVALLTFAVLGCASSSAGTGVQRSTNRIVAEELTGLQFRTAYELIRALRPHWLQTRGASSLSRSEASEPVVYLDGTEMGRLSVLREVLASDVIEAEHLSASEATTRYGSDHAGGAILITTRH